MKRVAICTINYTSSSETIALLKNLQILQGDFEVYILENGSKKNKLTSKNIPKTPYKKHFFISKTNLGFAGGNNLLIKRALKNNFDYFWILNNDTQVKPNSLSELLNTFDQKPHAGVVGSVVLQDENKIWWGGSIVDLSKGKIIKKHFGEDLSVLSSDITKTDEVNGAVMLIKKDVINKIGFFDTSFFHTAEDTDYSLRAKSFGFELYINPKSVVFHSVGKSSGGAYSAVHMYYVERGRVMLLRKWQKLNLLSFLYLLPIFAKRILAPLIKKGDFKSSLFTIRGIIEGFIKPV